MKPVRFDGQTDFLTLEALFLGMFWFWLQFGKEVLKASFLHSAKVAASSVLQISMQLDVKGTFHSNPAKFFDGSKDGFIESVQWIATRYNLNIK